MIESPVRSRPIAAEVAAMPVAKAKAWRAPSREASVRSRAVRVGLAPRWYSYSPSPPAVGWRKVEAV